MYMYTLIWLRKLLYISSSFFFMPLRSKIGAHIVFVLSVILSFCNSVLLSETLTLLITFEQWVLELWYITCVFLVIRPRVTLFLTLWPWPWSLTYFFKTLTLRITFEQWVLELWYFTWISLVMGSVRGFHYFWPCDLDLRVWATFLKH